MRKKHRNDYNHGKNGWIGGNPRYGKSRGNHKGSRKTLNQQSENDNERQSIQESEAANPVHQRQDEHEG